MTLPLVVGISGATGVVYAVELLRALRQLGRPSHLIVSEMAAAATITPFHGLGGRLQTYFGEGLMRLLLDIWLSVRT